MPNEVNNSKAVNEWMQALDHPLKNVAEATRRILLGSNPEIGEQIKWNAPAFFYTGEMEPFSAKEYKRDLVVFHLRKKDQVLLIFPNGATINNPTDLLEGSYTDGRRMVTLKSMQDLENKKETLQQIINLLIMQIEN